MRDTALLDGDVAVVTGGTSGIGRAVALTFAASGADVVVADVREQPREEGAPTAERIADETDANARYVDCDVREPEALREAVAAADDFGGVTVMVNNAGILPEEDFTEVTPEQYESVMAVNQRGVFFGAQAAARSMLDRSSGSIINVSSTSGIEGTAGSVLYSASKGAVRLMTYALVATLGPAGIRVNAVHPGLTETALTRQNHPLFESGDGEAGANDGVTEYLERTPLRRAGRPQDVADAALFLASDLADYVTAKSLIVDGGTNNTRGITLE